MPPLPPAFDRPVLLFKPHESGHPNLATRFERMARRVQQQRGSEQEAGDLIFEQVETGYVVSLPPDDIDSDWTLVDLIAGRRIFKVQAVLESGEIYGQEVHLNVIREGVFVDVGSGRSRTNGYLATAYS